MAMPYAVENKRRIWSFWQEMDDVEPDQIPAVLDRYVHEEVGWHGPHPFDSLSGRDVLYDTFWLPLRRCFPDLKRDPYILMAGEYDGKPWVAGTGNYAGTFAGDWLGIPATGQRARIRFGELYTVEAGKVVESYVILDLLDLMDQAGIRVLPPGRGQEGLVPGPVSHDGILLSAQDPDESRQSLTLVEAMLAGLGRYDQVSLASMEQARYWHPEMLWFGPHGIGTTRGLRGFEEQHQIPFLTAFPDRKGGHHRARFADGMYVVSMGWPSLLATHRGPYCGVAATDRRISMRVMDWWRREGDRLVENWVFIDMIDLFLQMGVDLMERMRQAAAAR